MRNALTIDVEDYFHVAALSSVCHPERWDSYECRVERNTDRLLEIFDENQVKATFFILGWVAERFPALVRRIAETGHEVASHGYSHRLIYEQTPDDFRGETIKSKQILEEITQAPVIGYRAASYSITKQSEWALDILAEAGFQYDSSIVPVYHDLYGIPGAPDSPGVISTPGGASLVEFPPSTIQLAKARVPVGGGGYFRIFPYVITRKALSFINQKEGKPFSFYLHPWEIDPGQPRMKVKLRSRFRHYTNLSRCEGRLRRLLKEFEFAPMKEVLNELELLERAAV